jgi:hypothetical protein
LRGFSIESLPYYEVKFKGNQYLFQRGSHFKRKDKSKKEKGIPVHHEKALFLLCHIVVLFVKIIYGTGIGNDVMDVVELDDFKLLYIEIICRKPRL